MWRISSTAYYTYSSVLKVEPQSSTTKKHRPLLSCTFKAMRRCVWIMSDAS